MQTRVPKSLVTPDTHAVGPVWSVIQSWNFPMAPGFKVQRLKRPPSSRPTLSPAPLPESAHSLSHTQHQKVMGSFHGNAIWWPGVLHIVSPKAGMWPGRGTGHGLTMTISPFLKLIPSISSTPFSSLHLPSLQTQPRSEHQNFPE